MREAHPPSERTDDQLAADALAGSRDAFGVLAARHYPGVTALVYRMTADPQFAEDAAQEAFLRAWQKLDGYDPGRSARPEYGFRNWLYGIAANYALDALRRQPQELPLEDLPGQGAVRGPEAAVQQREQAVQVQAAVLDLPPASRTALILREYQGLSYREIAEVLELPLGTVMSRLNYARQRLRAALEHVAETGTGPGAQAHREPEGSTEKAAAPERENA